MGAAGRDRQAADVGLRTDFHGRREDPDSGLARRLARALVGRDAPIAGVGAEAASLRLHRIRLRAGRNLHPATGARVAARLAPARSAVDRAVRHETGGEPGLYVGQCAGAAWGVDAGDR